MRRVNGYPQCVERLKKRKKKSKINDIVVMESKMRHLEAGRIHGSFTASSTGVDFEASLLPAPTATATEGAPITAGKSKEPHLDGTGVVGVGLSLSISSVCRIACRIRLDSLKSQFGLLATVLALSTFYLPFVDGSRAYPLGCSQETASYYDYDNCPFPPPGVPVKSTEDYQLVERLGTGKFGDVFSAVYNDDERNVSHENMLEVNPSSVVVIKVCRS